MKAWIRPLIAHKTLLGSLTMLVLVVAFLHYIEDFPQIFDIVLYDETKYMALGRSSAPLPFVNYELSSLYPLYYRVVSIFVGTPTQLYMVGGVLILLLAYIAESVSIFILS